MRLLKVSSFLLVVLVLFSCSEQTRAKLELFPSAQKRVQFLDYVKDNRTGLCFALIHTDNVGNIGNIEFTNVPCSSAVETLLLHE